MPDDAAPLLFTHCGANRATTRDGPLPPMCAFTPPEILEPSR